MIINFEDTSLMIKNVKVDNNMQLKLVLAAVFHSIPFLLLVPDLLNPSGVIMDLK